MGEDIKHILVSVCIKIIFLTQWRTILLVLCKMHLKRKIPQEPRLNIDNFFIYNFIILRK